MMLIAPTEPLLAAAASVSFPALVVPARAIVVGPTSLLAGLAGTLTVKAQTMTLFGAAFDRLATGSVAGLPLMVQAPGVSVAPTVLVLGVQVTAVAAAGPPLVQLIVPLTVLPGAATTGAVMVLVMSALGTANTSKSGCTLSLPLSFWKARGVPPCKVVRICTLIFVVCGEGVIALPV